MGPLALAGVSRTMVTYGFRCRSCGESQDIGFPMGQAPASVPCPCGEEAERVFFSLPVVFRPEGWDLSPDDPKYWSTLRDKEPRTKALQ